MARVWNVLFVWLVEIDSKTNPICQRTGLQNTQQSEMFQSWECVRDQPKVSTSHINRSIHFAVKKIVQILTPTQFSQSFRYSFDWGCKCAKKGIQQENHWKATAETDSVWWSARFRCQTFDPQHEIIAFRFWFVRFLFEFPIIRKPIVVFASQRQYYGTQRDIITSSRSFVQSKSMVVLDNVERIRQRYVNLYFYRLLYIMLIIWINHSRNTTYPARSRLTHPKQRREMLCEQKTRDSNAKIWTDFGNGFFGRLRLRKIRLGGRIYLWQQSWIFVQLISSRKLNNCTICSIFFLLHLFH